MKHSYLDAMKQQSSSLLSVSQIAAGVAEIHKLSSLTEDSEVVEDGGDDYEITDSDSWLEIDPLSLDSKLEKLQHEWDMSGDEGEFELSDHSDNESNDGENISSAPSSGQAKLNDLVSKMKSFLAHSSSIDGVEFPDS
jgi:hypothetical protein